MKSKNNTINKIISQIRGVSTDLKSQKIELSLSSDIQDSIARLDNEIDNASNIEQEIFDDIDSRDEAVENLGRSVSSGKESVDLFSKSISSARKTLNKAESMAKELGISPDDVMGYPLLDSDMNRSEMAIDKLRDAIGMAGRAVN
tara:strand:- start:1103 stop:1537 length:435 start_codon:yes stop_codon:yes gene_type:complete